MSDIDPTMFAYVAAGLGLMQLIAGVVFSRSTEPSKLAIAWILQSDGAGFLAAAAVCYLAKTYDWAVKAGFATFCIVFAVGYVMATKAGKARGAWK